MAPDKTWIVAAHQSNLAEIAAGTDAQKNATSKDVSALGKMLVTDHTKLDKSLTSLASKYDVTLPASPNAAQKSALASVKQNSGSAYDKAWVRAQTTGHLQAKAATAKEIAGGSASDVLAAARTATPVVQHHIDELASISSDLGITSPTSVNGGTGGQAASGGISGPGMAVVAVGLSLIAAAAYTVRRRRPVPLG